MFPLRPFQTEALRRGIALHSALHASFLGVPNVSTWGGWQRHEAALRQVLQFPRAVHLATKPPPALAPYLDIYARCVLRGREHLPSRHSPLLPRSPR